MYKAEKSSRVKNAAEKLDEIDQKIINELDRNSKLSQELLASRVGLSRNAVRQRIDRMERYQIIRGYTIRLGAQVKTTPLISAFIFLYRQDRMRGANVTAFIKSIPEVNFCHILSGEKDLLLRVDAPSENRIREIWDELALLPGVKDICTCYSLSKITDRQP